MIHVRGKNDLHGMKKENTKIKWFRLTTYVHP